MAHHVTILHVLMYLLLRHRCKLGKILIHFRIPEAQGIHRVVMISNDWDIIWHAHDSRIPLADQFEISRAIVLLTHIRISSEANLNRLIWFPVLPDKAILQPVIRDFCLMSINNLLFKQAIFITDTTAMSWKSKRSHGVYKAGCQSTKAAITKACIRFFLFL